MDKKIYTGTSLEVCLEDASNELGVKKEELKYKVVEEKKSLFKKHVSIEVEYSSIKDAKDDVEELNKKELDGFIKSENGEIFVKDPEEGGKPAIIYSTEKVKIFVNGNEIVSTEVYSKDKITFLITDSKEAERHLNITTSQDKLEGYISIDYCPKDIIKLRNLTARNVFIPELEISEQKFPPKYTAEEIKNEIWKNGIKFGIIDENIKNCIELEKVDKVLVAKGEKPIDGTDDTLEFMFEINKGKKFYEDKNGNVDFRSVGEVSCVEQGKVLAIKRLGQEGKDGMSILGIALKHNAGKKITLKVGDGCEIKNENTVIASRAGEPSYSSNKFFVHSVHEIATDVDLKVGNIHFNGDVIIHGEVKEGMIVEAGHNINVDKNVDGSTLISKGDTSVRGNIIFSKIFAGGKDVEKIKLADFLKALNDNIMQLISGVRQIIEHNLLGVEVSTGEVIKILLESKFKMIPRMSSIISKIDSSDNINLVCIQQLVKEKLTGLGPLEIKSLEELLELTRIIQAEQKKLNSSLPIPVNVNINYCQNSEIESSGNIIIEGKGVYVSNLTSNDKILFTNPSSVVRGGILKARNEIKCGTVGSEAGVLTKLTVDSTGNIYAKVAYQNSIVSIGGKESMIDAPSREVHAYINSKNELIVEKLKL